MVFVSKFLKLLFVLAIVNAGVELYGGAFSSDPTTASGLIMSAAAEESVECREFDVLKPPRFGKRSAYLDRYRISSKCINRRFLTALAHLEQMNAANPEAMELVLRNPAIIQYLNSLLRMKDDDEVIDLNALKAGALKLKRSIHSNGDSKEVTSSK